MATLNTLRTRFGILLSAIIAFALLAFIFSLKSEMGFGGSDPVIAEVNGKDITYSEYISEYEGIKLLNGVDESNEQQADMLYRAAWQALVTKFAMEPGYEELGIIVSDAERMAIIRGEVPTQTMFNNFFDRSTGQYNIEAINGFLISAQGNPEAERAWQLINEQARIERESNKYVALFSAGINLNDLEVASSVESANKSFAGRWASKRYSSIADSLVSISANEIKEYYNNNKSSYKREPSRTISYAMFPVSPSKSDQSALEADAKRLAEGFEVATDIRNFVRESRKGSIAQNYVLESQLPSTESSVLVTGAMYGPQKSGDNWRLSRVESILIASDTLTMRQIVLPYTESNLADSLYTALQSDGSKFAAAADQYSTGQGGAMRGGDIGAVPFSALTEEFATKLAPAKVGSVLKFEIGDMIQIIQVYDAGKRTKHYRLASIELPIIPSNETRNLAHGKAGAFAVDARGAESFNDVAKEADVTPRNANLTAATRTISSVQGSREVARWAHSAKVGEVSPIFNVDGGYLVAILSDINDNEYSSIKEVEPTIRRKLIADKKYDMILSQLSGSTFEQQAESLGSKISDFEGVNFSSTYVTGLGVEPRVIGAISSSTEGSLSPAIKGNSSLFIFVVDKVEESSEPTDAEAERSRVESMSVQVAQQQLFSSLESLAEVKDLRGKVL
ncbi:MAG: peptidylprolyl isomerase [Rikenellaceae bacterium]